MSQYKRRVSHEQSLLIGREPCVAHHPYDPILKPAGRARDYSDELAPGCDRQAPPIAWRPWTARDSAVRRQQPAGLVAGSRSALRAGRGGGYVASRGTVRCLFASESNVAGRGRFGLPSITYDILHST